MDKKEVQARVLKNGKPLDLDLFSWDEKTNTFSSDEYSLVLDFSDILDCTFKTGSGCTFKTGSGCTFDTSWSCTFNTSWSCTFKTDESCTFDTGENCTFDTGETCVVVRRDIYEVIELDGTKKIKLNSYEVKGYTIIDNKESKKSLSGKEVTVIVDRVSYTAVIK